MNEDYYYISGEAIDADELIENLIEDGFEFDPAILNI